MEIIIDCGDKELAKAIADKLSEDTGVARDKFKEIQMMWILVWMQLVTSQGVEHYQLGTFTKKQTVRKH